MRICVVTFPGSNCDESLAPGGGDPRGVDRSALDSRWGATSGVMGPACNFGCAKASLRASAEGSYRRVHTSAEAMSSLLEGIEALSGARRALETRFVSANVAPYNDNEGRAIMPTPTFETFGIVDDEDRTGTMASRDLEAGIVWLEMRDMGHLAVSTLTERWSQGLQRALSAPGA